MEQFAITARRRDKLGSSAARAYRREGLVPGVVYGHAKEPVSITIRARDLQSFLRHHGSLMTLEIEGQPTDRTLAALLKSLERDPVSREVKSVDLQWVSLQEAVEISVPVTLVGEAPGVKLDGGALDQVMHEISISALPADLPDAIQVDISELQLGHSLHVSDLIPPPGVTILSPAGDSVVTISKPVSAADLETHLEEAETVEAEAAPEGDHEKKAED